MQDTITTTSPLTTRETVVRLYLIPVIALLNAFVHMTVTTTGKPTIGCTPVRIECVAVIARFKANLTLLKVCSQNTIATTSLLAVVRATITHDLVAIVAAFER